MGMCHKNIWTDKPDRPVSLITAQALSQLEVMLLDMVILNRSFLINAFSHFLHLGKLLVFITAFGKEFHSSTMPYLKGIILLLFFFVCHLFSLLLYSSHSLSALLIFYQWFLGVWCPSLTFPILLYDSGDRFGAGGPDLDAVFKLWVHHKRIQLRNDDPLWSLFLS